MKMKLIKTVKKAGITEEQRQERQERKRLRALKDELNNKLKAKSELFHFIEVGWGVSAMGTDPLNLYAYLTVPGYSSIDVTSAKMKRQASYYAAVQKEIEQAVTITNQLIQEMKTKYPDVSVKDILKS